MAAIISKVQICNMALSYLGNFASINNIDTPESQKETTFALWYDVTRQAVLKEYMPHFAMARRIVAKLVATNPFGYANVYAAPNDSLRIFGIDVVDAKTFNYTIEGGHLYTDEDYPDGLPLRFLKDVEDVTTFSPEFCKLLAAKLALNVAMEITQDAGKIQVLSSLLPKMEASVMGMSAQENKPIRISRSNFREARHGFVRPASKQ